MDYRELLKKYIDHVGACEGVSFLSDKHRTCFSADEFNELQKLYSETLVDDAEVGKMEYEYKAISPNKED